MDSCAFWKRGGIWGSLAWVQGRVWDVNLRVQGLGGTGLRA